MTGKADLLGGFLLAALLIFPASSLAFETMPLAEVETLVEARPETGTYLLVDSRSEIEYFAGHIPWAVSIPWPELKERAAELPADRDTTLVFYCGGGECDLSTRSAEYAESLGYTNVHAFTEGMDAWQEAAIPWVSTTYLEMLISDRDKVALLIDARPFVNYSEGTVPGAVSIPWQEWDKRRGLLPADQGTELIFFCGGLKCDLSHKAAVAARALGYRNVKSYAYGWPEWQENSSRAFAMVNPREGSTAPAPEPVLYEGEIAREEFVELMEKKPQGFLLVDVRPEEDYKKGHLPGAIHILYEKVGENVERLKGHDKVVFYCNTGSRCAAAYYAAEDAGVKGTRFLNRSVDIKPDGSFAIE